MDSIGVRELRQNASVYLERVKKGESIQVTERGEPVAILCPPKGMSLLERLEAEGTITPATASLSSWLEEHPMGEIGDDGLSRTLQEMRDEDDR